MKRILFFLKFKIGTKYQPFMIFSIYTNTMKLFSCKMSESPDNIHCLHGIRVIGMLWVLLVHNFTGLLYLPVRNAAIELEVNRFINSIKFARVFLSDLVFYNMSQLVQTYRSMFIFSAPVAVDTFLVLSGLLVSLNLFMLRER